MNKLFALVLIGTLFIVSCGDDDDTNGLSLVGTTWTEVSSTSQGCDDPADNGTDTCTSGCEKFIFNADGTVSFPGGEEEGVVVTYKVSGSTITITIIDVEFGSFTTSAQFTIVGDLLTITSEDDFDGCTSIDVYKGA